jgi:hypothetical protein
MKHASILALITIVFSICASTALAQTDAQKQEAIRRASLKLADEDKKVIIKSLLEQRFQIKKQLSNESAKEKLIIKLSKKNIDADLLPEIPNVEFVLLGDDDIKNYKGRELTYSEFEKIEFKGYNVMVTFSTTNLARGFFPGKWSATYEYYKIDGKWLNRMLSFYIAN